MNRLTSRKGLFVIFLLIGSVVVAYGITSAFTSVWIVAQTDGDAAITKAQAGASILLAARKIGHKSSGSSGGTNGGIGSGGTNGGIGSGQKSSSFGSGSSGTPRSNNPQQDIWADFDAEMERIKRK